MATIITNQFAHAAQKATATSTASSSSDTVSMETVRINTLYGVQTVPRQMQRHVVEMALDYCRGQLKKGYGVKGGNFMASVIQQYDHKGWLTQNQFDALCRIIAPKDEKPTLTLDATKVREAYDRALGENPGTKHATLRTLRYLFYTDRYDPRHIAVLTDEHKYLGKIVGTKFTPYKRMYDSGFDYQHLASVMEHFAEAVIKYGHTTSHCGCCGRALTNSESIERGVGPICAARFGF